MSYRVLSATSLAALIAGSLTALPTAALADRIGSFSCVGGHGAVSCAGTIRDGINHPNIIKVAPPRTDAESAEADERDRRWTARCRPRIKQDEYGVPRYSYAARGCEFGKSE